MLLATVLAFFAHQALHVEPATVALTGAAVGLLVTRIDLEQALAHIEWTTLFFFVALFVMVGALEATGAIDHVAEAVKDADRRRSHGGADRDRLDRRRSAPRSSTTSPSPRR